MEIPNTSSEEDNEDEVPEIQQPLLKSSQNLQQDMVEEKEMQSLQISSEDFAQELPPQLQPFIYPLAQEQKPTNMIPVQEVKDVKQFQDIFVPQQNVGVEEQKTQIPRSAVEETKNQNARSYQSS